MSTDLPPRDAERVTRVGRWIRDFRLDEVPQFFAIIRGIMNPVGPRAEGLRAFEERRKILEGYEQRLAVKPGMAGWGMMHAYRDAREKLQYDLFYIKHRCLRFDVYIMWKTARRIVMRELR